MKKSNKLNVAAVLLALSAVTAAPVAQAQSNAGTQAENPCGGRKRSSNPCGPSNPCGSKRRKAKQD